VIENDALLQPEHPLGVTAPGHTVFDPLGADEESPPSPSTVTLSPPLESQRTVT
jgi:hypothetical protein